MSNGLKENFLFLDVEAATTQLKCLTKAKDVIKILKNRKLSVSVISNDVYKRVMIRVDWMIKFKKIEKPENKWIIKLLDDDQ